MAAESLSFVLSRFDLVMFFVAILFIFCSLIIGKDKTYDIIFRWMSFFVLGLTGLYAFIMHAFFQEVAASGIGWQPSPFEFEVAMANLAFGVLGVFAARASYPFRLATVIGATCWLWGDASVHLYQLIQHQDYALGNAGSWFWIDILLPFILIISLAKSKSAYRR